MYLVENGQRRWIPDTYTLDFYGGWGVVLYLSDADLNSMPEGTRLPSRVPRSDGTLLKGGGPKVFVMEGGERRWVPDPQTVATLGGWGAVYLVADDDLDAIPEGAQYPSVVPQGPPVQLRIDLESNLGANHFMTTHGALRNDGHVDAETVTVTRTWLGGFTGAVQCFFSDNQGITIGWTEKHAFGVDGTITGNAERRAYWSEDIDVGIAQRTSSLHVAHFWDPRYQFFANLIRGAVDAARPAVDLINDIKAGGGDAI